jgi:hypothetical protein
MRNEHDQQAFTIVVRVVDRRSHAGIADLLVEAWSRAVGCTELVAAAITGPGGELTLEVAEETLRELVGDRPATVFFRVFRGEQQLADTEGSLTWLVRGPQARLCIPVDVEAPQGSSSPARWIVRGALADGGGRPRSGARVAAFDRNLGKAELLLDEATTDAAGRYRIAYRPDQLGRPGKRHADLAVRAYDGAEAEIAARLICRAPPTAVVDLTSSGNARGPSELERLTATLLPLLGNLAIAQLNEDEIVLAACSAGVDRRALALLVAAHGLAEETDLPADVFYGLLRWGLPSERTALLASAPLLHRRALTWAIEENIVPEMSEAGAEELLLKLAKRVAGIASEVRTPGAGSLDDLLATAVPAGADRQQILERYVHHQGPIETFWRDLGELPGFSEDIIGDVQITFQLGALTRHHLPLVKRLKEDFKAGEIHDLRDLARLDVSEWRSLLIKEVGGAPIGAPAGIPGTTAEERLDNYASVLTWTLETAFPGAALAGRLGQGGPPLADAVEVLLHAPGFELGRTRVGAYLAQHPEVLTGVASPATTAAQLAAMERLHKLTPSASELKALMDLGLDSAHSVVRLGRAGFQELAAGALGASRAAAIYTAARQVTASSHALAARYHAAFNTLPAYVLPKPAPSLGQDGADVASWSSLFGSLDLCACGHCRSVYSPAAYLVDLLQFLDRQSSKVPAPGPKAKFSIFTQAVLGLPFSYRSARDVLLERRPDIANLELSCENTNTPVPYVDLVNEILEYAVANTELSPDVAFPDHIATEGTATELAAQPQPPPSSKQVVYDTAYHTLATRPYPWRLPFNLGQEEARVYLDHLGVPRARLMEVLRPGGSFDPADLPIKIALERLRLSDLDRELITGTSPAAPWEAWGLLESGNSITDPTGTAEDPIQGSWIDVLRHLAVLLQRSSATYEVLTELLGTDYVNPPPKSLAIVATPGADPLTCKLAELRLPSLDAAALDRFHRFSRLRRAIGWSAAELDQAIRVLGGQLDDPFLIKLAHVLWLQSDLRVPVLEVLAWWGPIQTRTPAPLDRSLYERLFQNKTVTNPVDDAFKLNNDSMELEDASHSIGDHAAAVLAALRLSAADLSLLMDAAVSQEALHAPPVLGDDILNLSNLSKLFRVASLARALKLPVRDLLALRALSGIDLFGAGDPEQTRRFVETAQQVRASRFGVARLDYLLRHVAQPSAGVAPDPAAVLAVLNNLADGLEKLPDESPPPANSAELLVKAESLVRQRLGEALKLDAGLIEHLLTKALHAEVDVGRKAIVDFLGGLDGGPVPSDEHRRRSYLRLEKVSTLVHRHKLTAEELRWVLAPEQGQPLLRLEDLPVTPTASGEPLFGAWLRLVALLRLRDALPAGKGALAELFHMAATGAGSDGQPMDLLAEIAARTGFSHAELTALVGPGGRFADAFEQLGFGEKLLRLADACVLLKRLGIAAAEVVPWADGDATPAAARVTAAAIRHAAKAKYDDKEWTAVARPLRDALRDRQRAALADVLTWKRGYAGTEELFAKLLIDVEMSPCQLTSRIKLAISSVQLFVQRCLLHLEADVALDDEAAREWKWMKSYRVWEANRKVFLYPEN